MANMRVGVVGATGAVGKEFLWLFDQGFLPDAEIELFASARSAGSKLACRSQQLDVVEVSQNCINACDFIFFSAGAGTSRQFAPGAIAAGKTVIDNSSAFRMDPSVKLIVPEVNGHELEAGDQLIANPNCTAAILLMAVKPLSQLASVSRLVVSTYQCASGAGARAMEELRSQTQDVLNGKPPIPEVLPHPYAFNLFSHNTDINEHGYNGEEWKVIEESRKMLGMPDLAIGVTCVRVPVMRAHALSVTIEFDGAAPTETEARQALESAPGVTVIDDREANHFPTPLLASGGLNVLVGRIRKDVSHPNALSLFICGDQLLKGAAQNAVQIAEALIKLRA